MIERTANYERATTDRQILNILQAINSFRYQNCIFPLKSQDLGRGVGNVSCQLFFFPICQLDSTTVTHQDKLEEQRVF